MIIRLNSETNLVKATEVKLIKTSDYQDTLTFKLPLDEQIFVDELVGVRTKVMKQDYRVKEIITKDRFKDVYCEHKFFDCKNIVIPFIDEAHRVGESYNDFSRYNSLQSIVGHLNRIMRTKGDTEFKFSTDIDKSGVVECDDTPLFDLIFGEKGILKTFNVELVYDNYKVKFVEKRPSKNTEILFHENKNVSELQETIDFKEIITKLHVTCKYTPDKTEEGKAERERLRAEKRRELFNKSQEKIKAREARQAQERALRRQKQEEAYQASRTAPKKTREQIHAEHLQKQQETENRISANNAARRQAREQKFNEREQQRVSKKQDKDDLIFRTVFVSPLVNRYARPYEASLNFQSSEINSEEALIAWCNANLFTDEDTRDVPLRNFSFKPVEDNYNVDINDRAMVNFTSIGTTKIVHCCKIEYDALHDKYLNIEFGVLNKSAIRETIGALNAKISETNSNISRTYDILDKNFDDYVQKELEAYSELFNIEKGEIEDTIDQRFEDAKIEAEKVYGNINTDIENKLTPIREEVRTTVEAYNQQFITTREVLNRNKAEADRQIRELNKNKVETEKQFRELNQRITGMQDISNNLTVVELKRLVNEAKETGKNINQKVTELEGNVTREFSSVKAKNENDLKVIRGEIKTGVDGLASKISSLEEYKNQDGSRTESLKQWVQRDTASQLSRERTEITRIVDAKGYVKNTEFSNKFNESARGITNQLTALETYKNQDAVRVANMQIWVQNNTANQLTAARRSIESWVNEKGYATTSAVENKVRETADSFSREISNVRNSIPTSVGGRNYILNSNFAKDLENWEMARLNNSGLNWQKGHAIDNFGRGLHIWGTPNGDYKGLGTLFNLVAKQGEKLTLSMDLGKDALTQHSILFIGLHYIVDNDIVSQQWQPLDLATQNFEVKKYKRISKTFTVTADMNRCRLMIHTKPNQLINFYIDNIKLEKGDIATDWTPAPEDNLQSINELNTWKQTTTQTLNTVSSTLNDTVKHSQLRVGADKIDFGSNKVFDGRNLASMLSVSPESIQAITDKLVITPANENLVLPEFRETVISNSRDKWITPLITGDKLQNGDQFIFEGVGSWYGRLTQSLNFTIEIQYKTGSYTWKFPVIVGSNEYSTNDTLKCTLTVTGLTGEVKSYKLGLLQNGSSNFTNITFKNAKIYKKKSAELIVDGSIEGRQIKTNTLETGHHKAGSITSEIIAANAVKAKHVLIDDGLINNLITHNAFINKLWAQQAFINKLNAVKIRSTQIDTDTLNGVVISGQSKIKIGQYGFLQPIEKGLQINAPENFGSRRGIGLQIAGEGVGPKESGVPPGLFIYEDPDFTRGNTVPSAVNRVLLTVAGMACFSSRILGSVVKGQPILTNLDYSSPFSNHAPVKFIGYKEGGLMRFFSTDNSNSDIWNIKVDQWGSDRKLKTDIKDSEFNAIEFVEKLKFKEHGWNKDEVGYERPYTKCGLIAQELQELDESLVVDYETYLGLDALRLINIALKAVQELSQQNKILKNKLEELIHG